MSRNCGVYPKLLLQSREQPPPAGAFLSRRVRRGWLGNLDSQQNQIGNKKLGKPGFCAISLVANAVIWTMSVAKRQGQFRQTLSRCSEETTHGMRSPLALATAARRCAAFTRCTHFALGSACGLVAKPRDLFRDGFGDKVSVHNKRLCLRHTFLGPTCRRIVGLGRLGAGMAHDHRDRAGRHTHCRHIVMSLVTHGTGADRSD